ncbi:MAG TPA: metal-sulfur cluster assembly factor [Gemmatimonadaceae bacterium]
MSESQDPTTPSGASAASPIEPAPSSPTPADPGNASGAPTEDRVRLALRKVKDPELNLNIMDLGLVYDVLVEDQTVVINMTLTSPGCPAGPQIMGDVERTVRALPGVADVVMNLVWEPYWTADKIEPRVRAYMGL